MGWDQRIRFMFANLVLLWAIELVNSLLNHHLVSFGVLPRQFSGLPGVLYATWLHGSIIHLLLNTVPLFVMGLFMLSDGVDQYIKRTLMIALLSGLIVWVIGRFAYHVGASMIIFGFFGFLVFRALYQRTLSTVLVAILIVFLYGGIIWGIFPQQAYISWEGHLAGLISGILTAKFTVKS